MRSAWAHWEAETVDGHADELAVLAEHAPGATCAEACMSAQRPAVVAVTDDGKIVAVWAGQWAQPPMWGAGRCEVRVDGPSASLACGPLSAAYLSVPFALFAETLVNSLRGT